MKKSLVILAALAIVSCQNTDELKLEYNENVQNIPMAFNAYSSKTTKATQSELNFFYDAFNVYGWKKVNNAWSNVFDDVTNEYFAADGFGTHIYLSTGSVKVADEWSTIQGDPAFPAWYYQNMRFWDKFATNYQFCAYAPITVSDEVVCTEEGVITIGGANATSSTLSEKPITVETKNLMATPATALAYTGFEKDYMTAKSTANYASGAASANQAVSLVFTHELSKFNIKLLLDKDNVKTKQPVVVNEVSLLNLNGTSYYDSSKEPATNYLSGWHTPETEMIYSAKGVGTATTGYKMNGETAGSDNFDGYFVMERLMIPQTAAKATVDCQITELAEACVYVKYTIGSEPFEGYYALANLFIGTGEGTKYDFEGGNEYTLTITVGPRPIYFTASVTPWTNHDAAIAAD